MIGKIILVRFPFSDLESSKKRPALVIGEIRISSKIQLVQIAMISSRVEGLRFPKDVLLKNWETSGLLHPSVVRLDKVATIDSEIVEKTIGDLSTADRGAVRRVLKSYFSAF